MYLNKLNSAELSKHMRRDVFFTFCCIGLLLYSLVVAQPSSGLSFSSPHNELGLHSALGAASSYPAPSMPPSYSPLSAAYVTNVSSLAHWQQLVSRSINTTHQMGLLHSFTSFSSRHPFVSGGNASLNLLETELGELGLAPESVWFPVMRQVWDGLGFELQPYWTRNLYVSPWGLEFSQPSLIVTCHVDSARYTYLGLTPTFAPGANDNAAGVVVLLETLRVLTKMPGSFGEWNVLFAFLSGEEGNNTRHLWGSNQMITEDLVNLGVDSSTAFILNVDEVGYAGHLEPTHLAIYHYSDEDVTSLKGQLEEISTLLEIPVEDMATPRVETLADVEHQSAWSTSEWTFHISGIPSLTLSTNQYPDPNKHTKNDVASICEPGNISNASKLVTSAILSFAYQIPPNPPDFSEEWITHLDDVASVTTVDYLNQNFSAYKALILDPNLRIDDSLTTTIVEYQLPILALGQSGANLLEILADVETTTVGAQSQFIDGFTSLHPAIGSLHLLLGSDARPFQDYSTVYAVTLNEQLSNLVGNETSCSMGYFADSDTETSILFIGIETPLKDTVENMATSSLVWLIEGNKEGIMLGVGASPPRVGDHTKIYAVMCDFLTMSGFPSELVQVNVTSDLSGSQTTQLVTNESGVATLELWIQSPLNYSITARCGSTFLTKLVFVPTPICRGSVEGVESEFSGERLSALCTLNSSWTTPAYVNLSLGAPLLGVTTLANLLLMPGLNIFRLDLDIPPTTPPGNYSLLISATVSELVLFYELLPLQVLSTYSLTLDASPSNVIQQEPFEILVNITNKGSQTRAFEVVVEGDNFQGGCQISVMAEQTLSARVPVLYLPSSFADIGSRLLKVHLLLEGQTLCSAQALIVVDYSLLNFTITLLPPAFLFGLILLGICWQRSSKRKSISSGTRGLREYTGSPSTLGYPGSYTREKVLKAYPFSEQMESKIAQVSRRFGLSQRGQRRFSNDQAVLAYKRQGDEIHVVVLGTDKRHLRHLIANLGESSSQGKEGG